MNSSLICCRTRTLSGDPLPCNKPFERTSKYSTPSYLEFVFVFVFHLPPRFFNHISYCPVFRLRGLKYLRFFFCISSLGQNSSVSVWDIRNSKTLKRFPAGSLQAEALLSQRGSQDGAAGVKSALGLVSLVASNQKSSALVNFLKSFLCCQLFRSF